MLRFADKAETPAPALEETFEAFGVTLKELRVAEDNLLSTKEVLLTTLQQLDSEHLRYRELFDLAPDGYLVTDLNGVIVDANRAAAAMLDVPQQFMAGKVLPNFVPESDRCAFHAALVNVDWSRSQTPWRVRLRPRQGDVIEVEVSVSPGANKNRRDRELLWFVRDLAGRDRPPLPPRDSDEEVALLAAERDRLRDLVDAVGVVIWEADPTIDRLTLIGREIEGILGRPSEYWLGVSDGWLGSVHPDDRPVVASLRSRQRVNRTDLDVDYRLLAPDGHSIWVRDLSRYSAGRNGERDMLRGVLININKRKKIERGLYYTRTEAETHARELDLIRGLCERLSATVCLLDTLDDIASAVSSLLGADKGTVTLDGSEVHSTERRSVCVEDVETEPGYEASRDEYRRKGVRAIFSTPLSSLDGAPIGRVSAFFAAPHMPSERQQALVELYARQAGQLLAIFLRLDAASVDPRALSDRAES